MSRSANGINIHRIECSLFAARSNEMKKKIVCRSPFVHLDGTNEMKNQEEFTHFSIVSYVSALAKFNSMELDETVFFV